jgi:hypothetical protein
VWMPTASTRSRGASVGRRPTVLNAIRWTSWPQSCRGAARRAAGRNRRSQGTTSAPIRWVIHVPYRTPGPGACLRDRACELRQDVRVSRPGDRRLSFNEAAETYDEVRPSYPATCSRCSSTCCQRNPRLWRSACRHDSEIPKSATSLIRMPGSRLRATRITPSRKSRGRAWGRCTSFQRLPPSTTDQMSPPRAAVPAAGTISTERRDRTVVAYGRNVARTALRSATVPAVGGRVVCSSQRPRGTQSTTWPPRSSRSVVRTHGLSGSNPNLAAKRQTCPAKEESWSSTT